VRKNSIGYQRTASPERILPALAYARKPPAKDSSAMQQKLPSAVHPAGEEKWLLYRCIARTCWLACIHLKICVALYNIRNVAR